MRPALIIIAGLVALTIAGCGNTANGLKQDGRDSSRALDNASHRVLSNGGS